MAKQWVQQKLAKHIGAKIPANMHRVMFSGKLDAAVTAGTTVLKVHFPVNHFIVGKVFHLVDTKAGDEFLEIIDFDGVNNQLFVDQMKYDHAVATAYEVGTGHYEMEINPNHILLESNVDPKHGARTIIEVDVDTFANMFTGALPADGTPPGQEGKDQHGNQRGSHAALVAADTFTDSQSGQQLERGYKKYFDQWKAQGIIS